MKAKENLFLKKICVVLLIPDGPVSQFSIKYTKATEQFKKRVEHFVFRVKHHSHPSSSFKLQYTETLRQTVITSAS